MLRTALKLAGAGLFVLVLAVALAFAFVQTGPGKTWLAGLIDRLVSGPGETVTVRGLAGIVPFDIRVAEITIADAAGPRLVIDDAALDVAAVDLLRGRLTIRDLTARAVRFLRSGGGTTPIGTLLNPPLPVTVQHLAIDALELGPAVLGTPLRVALGGNAALGGGRVGANLTITRLDAPGHADLHVAYGGTPERLQLAATIGEPSGAVLAGLLHTSTPVPLTLDLAGDGPLADWHGHLHVAAGRAGLGATFRVVGDGGCRLTAEGGAEPVPLLPRAWQPIIGLRVPFSVELRFAPDGSVTLDHLRLAAAAAAITAEGRYARDSGDLAGTLTLATPTLAKLEPLLGQRIAGAGTATLALSGKPSRPTIEATIDVNEPRVAGAGARQATAVIDIAPQGDPLDAATPIDLTAHGRLLGLGGVPALPADLGAAIDWRGRARLDRASGRLALRDAAIEDHGATLSLAADADTAGATGTARLALPDLSPLTRERLGGALDVTADFTATADGSATAVLSGALEQPKTGDARLDGLLGSELTLNGTLRRLDDGTLTASEVTVAGAKLRLTGGGRRQADGRLAADYHLDLPQVAALDPRLAGKAEADGHLEGPAAALSGTTVLKATALAAGPVHVDEVQATLAIADLEELRGSLDGRFRAGSLAGTFSASTTLAPGNILRVPQVAVAAAGAQIGGALSINLSSRAVDGKIDGRVADLRAWSALAGMPLGGSLELHAALDGQALDLAVNGRGVSWGATPASVQSVALTARLSDLLNRPRGRAELTLSGGAVGTAKIARMHLLGSATQAGSFAVTADAAGTLGGPFRLGATASALVRNGAIDLRVTQLSGTLAGVPLGLRKPLGIAWHGGAGSFADLTLGLGRGQLDGEGRIAGSAIALHLHATHLPVAALARLGGRDNFDGDLGFEITLGGTRLHPEGRVVVDAEELRLATASQPDLPALGIVAAATWRNDTVQFQGRVAGPNNAAVGFSGQAPLVLDPQRLAVHLPPSGPLALRLEGGGNLANLADLLPLGESRLSGRFAVDATVGGTVGDPQASGRLTVNGARYESLTAGTILSGVNFTLAGDRDRLVLRDFTANDGAEGALMLRGAVNLAATPGPAFDVSAALQRFRAIRRDELTAMASGELRLTGTVAAPQLAAQLTIDQATINLPKRLPQSAQPIQVVRIDSATGRTLSTPATTQESSPLWAVALDVHVSAPGQIFVRGRGLDSVWRGAVTATGTTAAPHLTGRLDVVRGSYDFLGKSFLLNRGAIAFLGGQKIDPTLNIEARSTSSDITAIVQLGGTMTQPTIKLSSEPQLPQDEILARVLFGTSISQISPAQGIQLAQAAASLAGGTNLSVLDTIRRGLGLDRLSIGSQQNSVLPNIGVPSLSAQPGVPGSGPAIGAGTTPLPPGAAAGAAGVTGTTVTAGKYVANGVYVGVSQGFTPGSSTVNAQIDVTRHISINTQASQAGGSGVGIDWKLDY